MSTATTSSPASSRVQLRDCLVGANPIIWSNDDFPELGGDLTLERCLGDMQAAGYHGSELGNKYPRTAPELGSVLARFGLKLVSGWHSTYLAERDLAVETASFLKHLKLLQSLGSKIVIVAECTDCVHGRREVALGFDSSAPKLTAAQWEKVYAGFRVLTDIASAEGMTVTYHHHMGTVVQNLADLDHLLAAVPALTLLFDPGHLAFAGIDPLPVLEKYGSRVTHVHLKNVRPAIVARARAERWSFCRAVSEGVFTIPGVGQPGDGSVNFPAIFGHLARLNYRGWLVVEAEEDPAKAETTEKARRARDYVRLHAGV
jgi:inosose dehydratase